MCYFDGVKYIESCKQKYRILKENGKPKLSQTELEEIFDGIDYDLADKRNKEVVKKHKEDIP